MFAIVRTALSGLRRDVGALALSFVLPIAFFSIFAMVFGNQRDAVPRVKVIVVDEDRSAASRQFVSGLAREGSLTVITRPSSRRNGAQAPEYTAATAEAAVKAGDVSVALVVPRGWGQNPVSFIGAGDAHPLELLNDVSDPIAPQVVGGLVQEVAMTSMPATMADLGGKYTSQFVGGFTPAQRKQWDLNMAALSRLEQSPAETSSSRGKGTQPASTGLAPSGPVSVRTRSVVGESKNKPMISFYAAAIGVMFLLFTASGAAGALLGEAESGTLDRVLSSRITMTTLLAGKLMYNMLLAFTQLLIMFLFAWGVFHVDLPGHLAGFLVMGICTAFAVAAFGILLAGICKTRGQLGALSTLLILIMSSVGGSMFPRFLMTEAMQKAGLFTINAWAIDGFTKVFWRDLPVTALWPQVAVLLSIGTVLFLLARRVARRWEFA